MLGSPAPEPSITPLSLYQGVSALDEIAIPVETSASVAEEDVALPKPAPAAASPSQTTQAPKKQSASTSDVPDVPLAPTILIAPVQVPVISASTPAVTQPSAPPAQELRPNVTAPVRETPSEAPSFSAAPAQPLPVAAVAFTSVLTPMKDVTAPVIVYSASTQEPLEAPSSSSTTATPASNSIQPSSSESVQSQIVVRTNGEGSNEEPGGDAPQQQQDDSPATSTHPLVDSTDSKIKTADAKLDDGALQPSTTIAAGAGHDRASNVTSLVDTSSENEARVSSGTQPETSSPFQSTAEALRTSEPNLPSAPPSPATPAQEISIRIAPPEGSPVDLRVVERSGQVHVDVRTADPVMQTSLRQDLGTLTSSLERAGYHSETFTPSSTLARAASSAQMNNQDDRQDSPQNRGGSGEFSGGRRQPQQQKRSSTWLEELEDQQ